jgi:biopolymer transport protein ExbD
MIKETVADKAKSLGADAEGVPLLIVSIKTDRETSYNTYIEVLDQVELAGIKRISIAEPEKG